MITLIVSKVFKLVENINEIWFTKKIIEQIKNKIIEKLYNEFRVILYKELDITLDQFLSFFHEDPLENKLLSAYDVGGAKGFKSEFYRKIYAYKFFMIKRVTNEKFKPIELLNFIHDQQSKRLETENLPKTKRIYKSRKKKIFIDPNQMSLGF